MSLRLIVLSGLGALAAFPVGLAAQERQPAPRARVFIEREGQDAGRDRFRVVTQRRARLGVTVDLRAGENDSIGATLQSVTPGGPAAKAGLRSGDIVTRIEGKSLVATDNMRAGEEESLPGIRLVEFASQLKPDDTVSVEYRRGAARRTASLVTGDEPVLVSENSFFGPDGIFEFNVPGSITMERRSFGGTGGGFGRIEGPSVGAMGYAFAFGGALADLELAPLNPDLGQYFGTTEGVLVISLPAESTLGLKGGDVILSVDGRKATGPVGLLKILRSYEPGDSFKFEVMRNKARTTVTGSLEKKRDQ